MLKQPAPASLVLFLPWADQDQAKLSSGVWAGLSATDIDSSPGSRLATWPVGCWSALATWPVGCCYAYWDVHGRGHDPIFPSIRDLRLHSLINHLPQGPWWWNDIICLLVAAWGLQEGRIRAARPAFICRKNDSSAEYWRIRLVGLSFK